MRSKTASVDAIRTTRLITAIKTPYLPNGKVDLASFDGLVESRSGRVGGIVVGGTTGEGQLMSWDEHIMLIAHTAKLCGMNWRLLVTLDLTQLELFTPPQGFAVGEKNTCTPLLRNHAEMGPYHSTLCDRHGCIAAINPYYGKTSSAGILQHFQAVMDFGPACVQCACTYLARYFYRISSSCLPSMKTSPTLKYEGNDRIKTYTDDGIVCWTGNDDEAHAAGMRQELSG